MRRYLITGASTYGVSNAGDDAMLWSLVRGLRKADPDCDIVLVCRHPSRELERAFNIRTVGNIDHATKVASEGRWFLGFNPGDSATHLDVLRDEFERADAVILGGNLFMEVSANSFMRGVASYALLMGQWALLFGRRLYITGLAVHPGITGAGTREIAKFLCSNARLIQVREQFTRDRLAEAGVDPAKVRVTGDPAYGIPIIDRAVGTESLAKVGIQSKRKLIGFNWRMLYWKASDESVSQEVELAARCCDALCERLDAEIVFLPNCTYGVDTPVEDDRTHHRAIAGGMRHRDRAHLWEREALVTELLPVFAALDLHVANRRHACICAAVQGTPFISLLTDQPQHFLPFLADLGVPGQALEISGLLPGDLADLAEKTISRRAEFEHTIRAACSRLAIQTQDAAKAIVDDVRSSA